MALLIVASTVPSGAQVPQLNVARLSRILLKESLEELPDASETSRWRHFDNDFGLVTFKPDGSPSILIDWTEQDGFKTLQNATSPDHTQRADFIRRVGEVIQRWAQKQGASYYKESFQLAADQWSAVLEYVQWEISGTEQDKKTAVKLALHSLRDLASYNKIYCTAEAGRTAEGVLPLSEELEAFAALTPDNIGPVVLRKWRDALILAHGRPRAVAASSNEQVKSQWRKLLAATDIYLALPGRLAPTEKQQFSIDRDIFPAPAPASTS